MDSWSAEMGHGFRLYSHLGLAQEAVRCVVRIGIFLLSWMALHEAARLVQSLCHNFCNISTVAGSRPGRRTIGNLMKLSKRKRGSGRRER